MLTTTTSAPVTSLAPSASTTTPDAGSAHYPHYLPAAMAIRASDVKLFRADVSLATVDAERGVEIVVARADELAKALRTHAESEFEKYRIVQDRLFFESDFDRVVTETRRIDEGAAKRSPRTRKKTRGATDAKRGVEIVDDFRHPDRRRRHGAQQFDRSPFQARDPLPRHCHDSRKTEVREGMNPNIEEA